MSLGPKRPLLAFDGHYKLSIGDFQMGKDMLHSKNDSDTHCHIFQNHGINFAHPGPGMDDSKWAIFGMLHPCAYLKITF